MNTLIIQLEGPMQSWGFRSRFEERDTGEMPTRSGVIGMICSAMGIARDSDLSRFDSLRMGIRTERPGIVQRDYQTSQDVIRASGTGKQNTVLSNRYYLADASFLVALEANDSALPLLQEIEQSLRSPKWSLFLGRKSYPLSKPPFLPEKTLFTGQDMLHVFRTLPASPVYKAKAKEEPDLIPVVLETDSESEQFAQNDWPQSFKIRSFSKRSLKQLFINPVNMEVIEWK